MPDGGASCFNCGREKERFCDRRKLARRSRTVNRFSRSGGKRVLAATQSVRRRVRKRASRFGEILHLCQVTGAKIRPGVHRRDAFAAKLHHSDDAVILHDGRAQDLLNRFVAAAAQRKALKHGGMAKGWKIVHDVGPPQARRARRQRRVAVQRNRPRRPQLFRKHEPQQFARRNDCPAPRPRRASAGRFRQSPRKHAPAPPAKPGSACFSSSSSSFSRLPAVCVANQHPPRVARPGSIIGRAAVLRPRLFASRCARNGSPPGSVTRSRN